MRKTLIAANWKMHMTIIESVEFIKSISEEAEKSKNEVLICPSFVALQKSSEQASVTKIKIGAQNMHFEEEGAFTGEISAKMIKDLCDYVILGHSERRHIFGEKDDLINKKVLKAISEGIIPILCVGETLDEREKGEAIKVVKGQLVEGLKDVTDSNEIVIAYEPVWAIGTGQTASKEQAQEMHEDIRKILTETFGEDYSQNTRILYGGSVKPGNVKELMSMEDIDGALVGGASLKTESFSQLINY